MTATFRVNGPDGLTEDDKPDAVMALKRAGKLPEAVAHALLEALLDLRVVSIEFSSSSPATAQRKVAQLRRARLLAEIVEPNSGETPEEPDQTWETWATAKPLRQFPQRS
jgi:hypothetical protein